MKIYSSKQRTLSSIDDVIGKNIWVKMIDSNSFVSYFRFLSKSKNGYFKVNEIPCYSYYSGGTQTFYCGSRANLIEMINNPEIDSKFMYIGYHRLCEPLELITSEELIDMTECSEDRNNAGA